MSNELVETLSGILDRLNEIDGGPKNKPASPQDPEQLNRIEASLRKIAGQPKPDLGMIMNRAVGALELKMEQWHVDAKQGYQIQRDRISTRGKVIIGSICFTILVFAFMGGFAFGHFQMIGQTVLKTELGCTTMGGQWGDAQGGNYCAFFPNTKGS